MMFLLPLLLMLLIFLHHNLCLDMLLHFLLLTTFQLHIVDILQSLSMPLFSSLFVLKGSLSMNMMLRCRLQNNIQQYRLCSSRSSLLFRL